MNKFLLLMLFGILALEGCAAPTLSTPRVTPSVLGVVPKTSGNTPAAGSLANPVVVHDDGWALMEWPTLPPDDLKSTATFAQPSPSPTISNLTPLEQIASVRFTKTPKGAGVEIRPVYLDATQKWVNRAFDGDSTLTYTILESNLNWELAAGTVTLNTTKSTFLTEGSNDILHESLKTAPADISFELRLPNGKVLSGKRAAFMKDSEFQALQQQPSASSMTGVPNIGLNQTPVKLLFRASLIRKNGSIEAIPGTSFTLLPYNQRKIRAALLLKNNPPTKPVDPMVVSGDLRRCNNLALVDSACDDYRLLLKTYREQLLPEWDRLAYVGEEAESAKVSGGRRAVTLKTNLKGEALVQLTPGIWYISGSYALLGGKHTLTWDSSPVEILPESQTLEASNENAWVLNYRF